MSRWTQAVETRHQRRFLYCFLLYCTHRATHCNPSHHGIQVSLCHGSNPATIATADTVPVSTPSVSKVSPARLPHRIRRCAFAVPNSLHVGEIARSYRRLFESLSQGFAAPCSHPLASHVSTQNPLRFQCTITVVTYSRMYPYCSHLHPRCHPPLAGTPPPHLLSLVPMCPVCAVSLVATAQQISADLYSGTTAPVATTCALLHELASLYRAHRCTGCIANHPYQRICVAINLESVTRWCILFPSDYATISPPLLTILQILQLELCSLYPYFVHGTPWTVVQSAPIAAPALPRAHMADCLVLDATTLRGLCPTVATVCMLESPSHDSFVLDPPHIRR
uniref:Uncharacterized protein n=2 Tax=Lygus hesperus TaxID=30085 RepID=A0A146L2T5_LYGHE